MKYLITILAYLLFITQTISAQEVVPVHQEPRHHLVYENDILQVLDVQIPVGDTTLYHTHDAPIFYVFISASSTDDQELGITFVPWLKIRNRQVISRRYTTSFRLVASAISQKAIRNGRYGSQARPHCHRLLAKFLTLKRE